VSKTIHLIRHAKSSWDDPALDDIDRPLNKRGKGDVEVMAQAIFNAGCPFANVFCSPAKRARQTIKGLYKNLPTEPAPWQIDDRLYTFDSDDLVTWCRGIDSQLPSVVIVGHNPALTELSQFLIPDCEIENVPTCAYVNIELVISNWKNLEQGCGKLVGFLTPKQLKLG